MNRLFNISLFSELSVADGCLEWLRTSLVPSLKENPDFHDVFITEVITSGAEQPDVRSFAVQAKCESDEAIAKWNECFSGRLLSDLFARFGESVMPLPTVMKIL